MLCLLHDIKVGDIVYFEDAASESNDLYSGYATANQKQMKTIIGILTLKNI